MALTFDDRPLIAGLKQLIVATWAIEHVETTWLDIVLPGDEVAVRSNKAVYPYAAIEYGPVNVGRGAKNADISIVNAYVNVAAVKIWYIDKVKLGIDQTVVMMEKLAEMAVALESSLLPSSGHSDGCLSFEPEITGRDYSGGDFRELLLLNKLMGCYLEAELTRAER